MTTYYSTNHVTLIYFRDLFQFRMATIPYVVARLKRRVVHRGILTARPHAFETISYGPKTVRHALQNMTAMTTRLPLTRLLLGFLRGDS